MPLDVEAFIRLRPSLLHVTSRDNARWIREDGRMLPASRILRAAGMGATVRQRRAEACVVRLGERDVYVRDQRPLHAGNMRLLGGWTLGDFVEHLNEHVYFWPAGKGGPGAYGRRLFERYRDEDQVVLTFDTALLVAGNRSRLRLCGCNSGAPRCNPTAGKAARGPGTLATPGEFEGSPGRVVEVAFRGEVEIGRSLVGVANVGSSATFA